MEDCRGNGRGRVLGFGGLGKMTCKGAGKSRPLIVRLREQLDEGGS